MRGMALRTSVPSDGASDNRAFQLLIFHFNNSERVLNSETGCWSHTYTSLACKRRIVGGPR